MADDVKERVQDDSLEEETPRQSRGRGWFGDSEAHARAGRKGGLARSRKYNSSR